MLCGRRVRSSGERAPGLRKSYHHFRQFAHEYVPVMGLHAGLRGHGRRAAFGLCGPGIFHRPQEVREAQ